MLAFLVRTVRIASLKLFCRPCLVPIAPAGDPLRCAQAARELRTGHRSLECNPAGSPFNSGFGVLSRDGGVNISSRKSSAYGSLLKSKLGNLKLWF